MVSQLLYGFGFIALMCAMIWIGRPARGADSVPWLRVYIIGQVYALAAMLFGIIGLSLLLQNSPWP